MTATRYHVPRLSPDAPHALELIRSRSLPVFPTLRIIGLRICWITLRVISINIRHINGRPLQLVPLWRPVHFVGKAIDK